LWCAAREASEASSPFADEEDVSVAAVRVGGERTLIVTELVPYPPCCLGGTIDLQIERDLAIG